MGVWKALGVVVADDVLHGHVRCGGGLCQDRGLGGPSPAELEEAGALVCSGNDGDIGLRHRARSQGDRARIVASVASFSGLRSSSSRGGGGGRRHASLAAV